MSFEARQIMVTNESIWRALVSLGEMNDLRLDRIPDGADEAGRPFFREQKPETECPQCGHTPTYAYMPKSMP